MHTHAHTKRERERDVLCMGAPWFSDKFLKHTFVGASSIVWVQLVLWLWPHSFLDALFASCIAE